MSQHYTQQPQRGFTLIELMITVAIIALIASIALPSYASYVQRTRRAEAKTFIYGLANQLERCYTRFGTYNHPSCSVGAGPFDSPKGYYRVAISNFTAFSYTLTATPQAAQTTDTQCGRFEINHLGLQSATGTLGSSCWDK